MCYEEGCGSVQDLADTTGKCREEVIGQVVRDTRFAMKDNPPGSIL